MKTDKVNKVKKIFIDVFNREIDPDWSEAANVFVAWIVENNFNLESFNQFIDWIDDELVDDIWHFFFGYSDDYKKFAVDWVEPNEQQSYLDYSATFTF